MKKSFKTLLTLMIIGGIAAGGYYYYKQQTAHQPLPPQQAIFVSVSPLKLATIPDIVNATGNLVANQKTTVSPKVSGYITRINFKEGDRVTVNQILVQLDNSKEKDAVASAKANAALSELQYERNIKLLKKGLVVQKDFYTSKVNYEKDQAALKTAHTNLIEKTIRAPFSGIVGARNISIGDFVTAGSMLVKLVDNAHLRAEYSLPTRFVYRIKLGQQAIITTDNLPNKKFMSKVTYIAPAIDPDTQTISVHASLDNRANTLKPGEFIHILQQLGPAKKALVAPTRSVFSSLKGRYVFIIKNNKAVKLTVTTGEQLPGFVEISSGLKAGDLIVTVGQDQLKDGAAVKVVTQKP